MDTAILEPDQEKLLISLVEAYRNLAPKKADFFFFVNNQGTFIQHGNSPLPISNIISDGDIKYLADERILIISHDDQSSIRFNITPVGFKQYESLKRKIDGPATRVESVLNQYLNAQTFQNRYPLAYKKLSEAERLLWADDCLQQLTVIGHLCRESVQEFAETLVKQYGLCKRESQKTNTVARIRLVLEQSSQRLGKTKQAFLDALLAYWGTVNDLIQRQEHGGQKEGKPLGFEDGRLVVFQTMIVMFEIDRALHF